MKCAHIGATIALAILMVGCGAQPSGTLEVTENGTYDVSGYAEVVVDVGPEELDSIPDLDSLDLVRVQFRGFSMEIPSVMVNGYTEAELTENNIYTFSYTNSEASHYASISVMFNELHGLEVSLDDYTDAPQEDINGITMAIKHQHAGDSRQIDVLFIYDGVRYNISLFYPIAKEDLYADYSENFYRTIQMN